MLTDVHFRRSVRFTLEFLRDSPRVHEMLQSALGCVAKRPSLLHQDPPTPPQRTVLASKIQGFMPTLFCLVQSPVNGRQAPGSAWYKPLILYVIGLFCGVLGPHATKWRVPTPNPLLRTNPALCGGVRRVLAGVSRSLPGLNWEPPGLAQGSAGPKGLEQERV